jgi:hypothetical protein
MLSKLGIVKTCRALILFLATSTGLITMSPGTASAAERTITCEIKVLYPHNSRHFPGTVNVEASVECGEAVPAMSLAVQLFTATGKNKLKGNAANGACIPGTYRGVAAAVVQFPSGFKPPQLNLSSTSVDRTLSCPTRNASLRHD